MAAAPPCGGLVASGGGRIAALTYNPGRDDRHSPPRPHPVQPPGCGLCDETRALLDALLRRARGRPAQPAPRRARHRHRPELAARVLRVIPVVELGDRRLELATSAAELRRLLADVLDARPPTPDRDERHGPHDPRRARGRPDQLPLAVRAAARAGLPRPADRDRGRRPASPAPAVALAGRPSRARVRRRVRGRLHAARASRPRSRPGTRRLPAAAARRRRRSSSSSWASTWPGSCASRASNGRGGRSTPARRQPGHGDRRSPSARGERGGTARGRRSAGRPARRPARRLARVVRPRRDLRHRLDAVHRHHPRRRS